MTTYQYATILRATQDDPHPNNNIEEGDIIVEAGKLPDGDSYTVLTQDEMERVELETVEVYELPEPAGEFRAQQFARGEYVDEIDDADASEAGGSA